MSALTNDEQAASEDNKVTQSHTAHRKKKKKRKEREIALLGLIQGLK